MTCDKRHSQSLGGKPVVLINKVLVLNSVGQACSQPVLDATCIVGFCGQDHIAILLIQLGSINNCAHVRTHTGQVTHRAAKRKRTKNKYMPIGCHPWPELWLGAPYFLGIAKCLEVFPGSS